MQISPGESELQHIYNARFIGKTKYRNRIWQTLVPYFSKWIPRDGTVLDLGAGYCEFINNVKAGRKYAMDLNPDVQRLAAKDVTVFQQDCSLPWPLERDTLDAVFTSNFLEHLPDKGSVRKVLSNAFDCLKPGGRFIAMGPNIKYLPGAYWDFFDHYVELSDLSLAEALSNCGYLIEERIARFLPYTMSHGPEYPNLLLRIYLALPVVWPIAGRQFLVIGQKPVPKANSELPRS